MTIRVNDTLKCSMCGQTPVIARGLCHLHYHRERNSGRLKKHRKVSQSDAVELLIDKTGSCWIYTGSCNQYGYGNIYKSDGKRERAHRFFYKKYKGKIPKGKIVRHTCDNPPCVNPDHLILGTKADNNRDTAIRRRHNYGLDHWNGRLSEKQIQAIRASNKPSSFLVEKYGVSQSHISRIRNRKRRT